ncbi:transcriptional repressor [Actinotalea sp. M2MS4P-6]|uniref:Fur family transcriptional regulator n=1 Tax=Actinotalea sp. M2MS4P-6 TaxID=2983762 RepID=UPI0021E405DD|nr:Fur family transcriptional regulator [Actinotalea sp. M2MS4P-6]MCV2393914.1 transcriptional repressor [Actinotalea sp. M2MS4P-6]
MQRMTRQRSAVTDALEGLDEFRSAQQLHELLRANGEQIGLATVYRTLASLADDGVVDVLRTTDGEQVYRRCARPGHHHHLVCRDCGRAEEIEGPGVEAWADQVGAAYGFAAIEHTVELTGVCPDCRAARRS